MPNLFPTHLSLDAEANEPTPIFSQKLVERCHVILPGLVRPVSAIAYENAYYAFVKFFKTVDAAQRSALRLREKGNKVLLTRVPKGLVLWVFEADAYRVRR